MLKDRFGGHRDHQRNKRETPKLFRRRGVDPKVVRNDLEGVPGQEDMK